MRLCMRPSGQVRTALWCIAGKASCRTGPLRVGRPLRGVSTGLGRIILFGPTVGREMMIPTDGRTYVLFSSQDKLKRRAERPPHA